MQELTDARWIKLKGFLFFGLGLSAALLFLAEQPTLKGTLLLTVAVWGFCRAYYFAFYVIERYVDPTFRFSGLCAFVCYWFGRRNPKPRTRGPIQ